MRLTWDRYLDHVRAEGERLTEAAAAHLDAPAPWCPGWVGRDVVSHTGFVHRRIASIVGERWTERPEATEQRTPPDDALFDWYREGLDRLLDLLAATAPDTPVYTWHRPDQTVGFWIRRMAHETVIHRCDAESVAGAITPLDPALAADGFDEVLGPIMCAYTEDPHWSFEADGRTAELRMSDTGYIRHLVLGTGKHGPGWLFAEGPAANPAAVLEATASTLDLWAWGRADPVDLAVTGDASVAAEIRGIAASVT